MVTCPPCSQVLTEIQSSPSVIDNFSVCAATDAACRMREQQTMSGDARFISVSLLFGEHRNSLLHGESDRTCLRCSSRHTCDRYCVIARSCARVALVAAAAIARHYTSG